MMRNNEKLWAAHFLTAAAFLMLFCIIGALGERVSRLEQSMEAVARVFRDARVIHLYPGENDQI